MRSLVVYNARGTHSSPAIGSGSGGGYVEDILKRLGNVESDVSELKSEVRGILAIAPHLATKADVTDVRTAVADLRGEMNALRGDMKSGLSEVRAELAAGLGSVRAEMAAGLGSVRAEMAAGFGAIKGEMAARETAFLKWIIATVLTSVGLAFTVAKFVH
jgi:hypothetical protein